MTDGIATNDCIVWKAQAPVDLRPLVPKAWVKSEVDQYRYKHQFWRREEQRWDWRCSGPDVDLETAWYADVSVGSGHRGVSIIIADGEIAFHKDYEIAPYGYLLVLRDAGYNVTGARTWRGMERQGPGTLMCFRQETHKHALVRQGTPRSERNRLTGRRHHRERPGKLWVALVANSNEFHTPEKAFAIFEEALMSAPVNAYRRRQLEKQLRLQA